MNKVDIDSEELKTLLLQVYNRAVNSYYDLSEIVVDEIIEKFHKEKINKKYVSILLQEKDKKLKFGSISLCPLNYDSIYNFTSESYGVSLANYTDYNNTSFANITLQTSLSTTSLYGERNGL